MMKAFEEPFSELAEYDLVKSTVSSKKGIAAIDGCVDPQKLHMIYGMSDDFDFKIIVTFSETKARQIYEDYRFYDPEVYLFPTKDLIFYQADIHSNDLTRQRIRTMRRLIEGRPVTVVTTFAALMSPQIPAEVIKSNILALDKRKPVDEQDIARKLVNMGYEKVYQVEGPGQFSVRGDIIDVFDLTEENPYRIELFGDDIESMRSFDIMSQRSLEKLESIEIYPASELILTRDRLEEGFDRITAEFESRYDQLRKAFKTEESARLKKYIEEKKEEALEYDNMSGLESFLRYFVDNPSTFLELFNSGSTMIFIDENIR